MTSSSQSKAIVLYSGYSLNNTPKATNIKSTLSSCFDCVSSYAITKMDPETSTPNAAIYSINANTLFQKSLKAIIHSARIIYRIIKERPDVIYAINPISGIIAVTAAAACNAKVVYETHEIFCGVNYQLFNRRSRHFWRTIEKFIANRSIMFFTTDPFREKLLRRYYKLDRFKISYLLNTPSIDQIPKRQHTEDSPELKIISYCGGIEVGREIENIIDAYYQSENSSCRLLLAGSIREEYKAQLIRRAQHRDPTHLHTPQFTGQISNDRILHIMQSSAITFAFYDRSSLNNRLCSPNKLFESLHAGTHVITNPSPMGKWLLSKTNHGTIVNPKSIKDLSNCINDVLHDRGFSSPSPETLRLFSWETESKKIIRILSEHAIISQH